MVPTYYYYTYRHIRLIIQLQTTCPHLPVFGGHYTVPRSSPHPGMTFYLQWLLFVRTLTHIYHCLTVTTLLPPAIVVSCYTNSTFFPLFGFLLLSILFGFIPATNYSFTV